MREITQWAEVATQNTNTAATATRAGVAQMRHYITGYSISCGAAPSAAVSATLTNGGVTVEQVELPAAAFSPVVVNFSHPIRCDIGAAAVLTCPAVGGVTRSTVVLRGYTESH
jgi:hypothetical protein